MGDDAAHGGQGDLTAEALERGRKLFAGPCDFIAGAAAFDQLPPEGLPEVAFAGRSNVGKSSLINALTGRKTLARVSHTPGRTQQLNFFDLGHRLLLVDLPGYGFAQAAKAKVAAWTTLSRDYLKGRASLRRICLLVDARHGLKPVDREAMDLLDQAAVSYQAVLTKADELKPAALATVQAGVAEELAKRRAAHPAVPATSAHGGLGIGELRAALAEFAL